MGLVEYSPATLEAAGKTLDATGPVYMVNMVRFRDRADYRGESELPPCSGREAYFQRYAPAFNKVARDEDYGLFWVGNVRGVLVGAEGEHWDDIVIVRYSSFAALRRNKGVAGRSGFSLRSTPGAGWIPLSNDQSASRSALGPIADD